MRPKIDLHEFAAQLESTTDQQVMNAVCAQSKSDCGHVVERTATSVWLYHWSDQAPT